MASGQWWVVFYEPIGTRSPGTAASLYQLVQAATKADAEHEVQIQGAAVNSAKGPYATQAAAQQAATGSSATTTTPGAADRSSTSNVEASGGADVKFPSWSLSISGLAGWFFRGLKIALGSIMMIIGVTKWVAPEVRRGSIRLPLAGWPAVWRVLGGC